MMVAKLKTLLETLRARSRRDQRRRAYALRRECETLKRWAERPEHNT